MTPSVLQNLRFTIALVAALLPLNAAAQGLRFGTNVATPGTIIHFAARQAKGALVLPEGYTNLLKPARLLVVSVPSGGSAISYMPSVTNVALSQGWAVLAADGPKVAVNDDTIQRGWSMLSSVLQEVARTWPQTKRWKVACAGFSGGAKRSAAVGAAMVKDGWQVTGVFMGGCNEDRTTTGMSLFQPGPAYKSVKMFLSNGESDPIAGADYGKRVKDSMTRSGFTNVRLEIYPGEHRLNKEHLREALVWFER
jgi:predicted esterase